MAEMQVPKFKEFISEAKEDKKFLRLLIITDEPEKAKEFLDAGAEIYSGSSSAE